MSEGLLSLQWNNHKSTLHSMLATVRDKDRYSDCTLACDGELYLVHKLVLSMCSDYFERIFDSPTHGKHPVIVLKDIRKRDLECLLNYMYIGEVNVIQENLAGLIKAAECLRIKGLAVPDEDPSSATSANKSSAKKSSPTNNNSSNSSKANNNSGSLSTFSNGTEKRSVDESSSYSSSDNKRRKVNNDSVLRASSGSNSDNNNKYIEFEPPASRTNNRVQDSSHPVSNDKSTNSGSNSSCFNSKSTVIANKKSQPSDDTPSPGSTVKSEAVLVDTTDIAAAEDEEPSLVKEEVLDEVYLSDSGSPDPKVENSQQHFMEDLLLGDYNEGGGPTGSGQSPMARAEDVADSRRKRANKQVTPNDETTEISPKEPGACIETNSTERTNSSQEESASHSGSEDDCLIVKHPNDYGSAGDSNEDYLYYDGLSREGGGENDLSESFSQERYSQLFLRQQQASRFGGFCVDDVTPGGDYSSAAFGAGGIATVASTIAKLNNSYEVGRIVTNTGNGSGSSASGASGSAVGVPRKTVNNIHSGEIDTLRAASYPHVCEICGYRCREKSDFVKHTYVHTGEKPFPCSWCDHSCRQISNLITHIRKKHPDHLEEFTRTRHTNRMRKRCLMTTYDGASLLLEAAQPPNNE